MVAAKHVGIKIDLTGPNDGAELELAVDGDSLEDAALVADRAEHAAGLQQIREVDLQAPSPKVSRSQWPASGST